ARAMYGTTATLGIIPTGTQNNVGLSLGIPTEIPQAIALLREGKKLKVDMGIVRSGNTTMPFLEVCSVGLFTALFNSTDGIQHGDISRIGDFLSTLTSCCPSKIRLLLNDEHVIEGDGHAILISNMPYVGRHYQVGKENCYNDGLLDVLLCTDVSKLSLMVGYMLRKTETQDDQRVQHYKARSLVIDTEPAMPVMADGKDIEKGQVQIELRKHALSIMAGSPSSKTQQKKGEKLEKQ
ncbi:MAG: diacylglycerol kinase family protein, partial [Clostridia bacterium]|nr:diacylglycerol kinase family protein [Clostridia bacterium]